jgi:Ser/Thr protein kinase RdoA (MazF antagonist)
MFSLGDHAIEPVDRIVARRDLLANALTLLMRFCGIPYPRLSRLDWSIHGDFAPRNVLANAESVSGIVDWDDCQVEWLAWDLAKAAWEFCEFSASVRDAV